MAGSAIQQNWLCYLGGGTYCLSLVNHSDISQCMWKRASSACVMLPCESNMKRSASQLTSHAMGIICVNLYPPQLSYDRWELACGWEFVKEPIRGKRMALILGVWLEL